MDSDEMEKELGFSAFTSNKQARKFDFMEMFEKSHTIAKQRNEEGNRKLDEQTAKLESENQSEEQAEKDGAESDHDDDDAVVPTTSGQPEDPYFIPMAEHLLLNHGPKPLTAVALDPSGSRVATGGFDFDVKLWDFSGMDKSCRAFKIFQPSEDQQVKHIEFSPTGDNILIISGSPQAKIFTRDAEPYCETIRGYQYITDPASAKGHTHALNGGTWHPIDSRKFLTWSQDTTLRVWEIDTAEQILDDTRIPSHSAILKPRNKQGRKTTPTAGAYSKDGFLVAAGCEDGSLQVWDTRRPLVNTSHLYRTAHPVGTYTTCLCFSWDGHVIASRAMDDTVRLWDLRVLSRGAVYTVRDLPVLFEQTEVCFSPNDTMVAAAVSATRGDPTSGEVVIFRKDTFEPIHHHKPGSGSAIRVAWHPRIRQIVTTFSNGTATVHFDPAHSRNGALMCAYRQASEASRRRRQGYGCSSDAFIKPTLLTFDEDSVRVARKMRRRFGNLEDENQLAVAAAIAAYEKDLVAANEAARKAARKRVPNAGEDVGQRVGSLHKYMVQQIVLRKNEADERAEKDIRGAILRHAEAAKKEPFWTKAYLKTQPNPIFQKDEPSSPKRPKPS
ncbi:WD repeat-containing protein 70 [Taenia solium]